MPRVLTEKESAQLKKAYELRDKMLAIIAEKGKATKYDLHKSLNLPYSTVHKAVKETSFRGFVDEKTGELTKAGLPKKIYTLTPISATYILLYQKLNSYSQVLEYIKRNREAIPLSEALVKAISNEDLEDIHTVARFSFSIQGLKEMISREKDPSGLDRSLTFIIEEIIDDISFIKNKELREMSIGNTIDEVKKIISNESIKKACMTAINNLVEYKEIGFKALEKLRSEIKLHSPSKVN